MDQIISKLVEWWNAFIAWMCEPVQYTIFTALFWMVLGAVLVMCIERLVYREEQEEEEENGDPE